MIKKALGKLAESILAQPQFYILEQSIMARELPAIIARALSPDHQTSILDIGCGPARYAHLFNGSRYIGVDMEERYVRFAQKRHRQAFARMDATALGFKDQSFDYVLIAQMLHHVSPEGLTPLIKDANRVLKDSGYLVIVDIVKPADGGRPVGNLLLKMDRGGYIRYAADYPGIVDSHFKVQEMSIEKMGFYSVVALRASKSYVQEAR